MFGTLYLDENVSIVVADILRSKGFDAVAAQDVGNKGLTDIDQMEVASRLGRIMVTHDRVDFERLAASYFESHKRHSGIIIAHRRQPNAIASRLVSVLHRFTADEMVDQIIYI